MPEARRRQLRSTKACDYCHRRRIKCRTSEASPDQCQNCVDFGLECQLSRPLKRGKAAASKPAGQVAHAPKTSERDVPVEPVPTAAAATGDNEPKGRQPTDNLSLAWTAFALASAPLVKELLSIYFETVYPIFPFFDRQRLESRVSAQEQIHSRGFFCSVMAACALVSARVRDGALVSMGNHSQDLAAISPETFFDAAHDTLPSDLLQVQDFDGLRACALLSIASLQDGRVEAMRMYIGRYFTMVAAWGWHNESTWPSEISAVDREERRRLYWSTYTLDVFTSIVWDSCVHFQEAHAKVTYPKGEPDGIAAAGNDSWMIGWNFTTDLYRILEHVLCRLRSRSSRFNLFHADDTALKTLGIEAHVSHLYSNLPECFKDFGTATGRADQDIYGFQAANIQATLALLRMALISLEGDVDLDKKCSVVSNVLKTFHQVPKAFQRAISTPLIYHIGGIGNILGSVMENPLSESSYRRVKTLLLSMADLLESLESFLHQKAGAGRKLRQQVDRIDEYMISRQQSVHARAEEASEVVPPSEEAAGGNGQEIDDLSPQFQIPDNLLQDWDWNFNMYPSNFPYFIDTE